MSSTSPITLPPKKETRGQWLGFRVSAEEKGAIDALAVRLGVTPSYMARHFLLQAVGYIGQNLIDSANGAPKE